MKNNLQGIHYIWNKDYLYYIQHRVRVRDIDMEIDIDWYDTTATWGIVRCEQRGVTGIIVERVHQDFAGHARQVSHSVVRTYAFMKKNLQGIRYILTRK